MSTPTELQVMLDNVLSTNNLELIVMIMDAQKSGMSEHDIIELVLRTLRTKTKTNNIINKK
jgi:hypothetical protein